MARLENTDTETLRKLRGLMRNHLYDARAKLAELSKCVVAKPDWGTRHVVKQAELEVSQTEDVLDRVTKELRKRRCRS